MQTATIYVRLRAAGTAVSVETAMRSLRFFQLNAEGSYIISYTIKGEL